MVLLFSTGGFAQDLNGGGKFSLQRGANPSIVQKQYDLGQLVKSLKGQTSPNEPNERQRIALARTSGKHVQRAYADKIDTVSYYAAAQLYAYKGIWYDGGGEIKLYNVGIAVDGTKVTFKHLLNIEDPANEADNTEYDVEGKYDPQAKTITIPTSSVFSKATVVGQIQGNLIGTVVCGTVKDQKMDYDDNLVFKVIGNFDAITTNQAIGVKVYQKDGREYGVYNTFRNFYLALPKDKSKIITFNNYFDFGETFPNTPVTKKVTLVNLGKKATDYVVDITADDETSYKADPAAGTLNADDTVSVEFTFNANELTSYDAIATINYDDADEADPLTIQMTGKVKAFPDYSGCVKSGNFDFRTGIEYPFVMQTLKDGNNVAQSATHGKGNATSWLEVSFTVPEKTIGSFSWKGKSCNGGQWYSNAGGYFVDNNEKPAATYNGYQDDISDTLEFGPGKHTVRFQYESYAYTGDEYNKLYVYDLNLDNKPADADKAILETEKFNFGSFILDNNTQEGTGNIVFLNRGYNPLEVKSVSSDNAVFGITKPSETANTMEKLNVPISFSSDKAGKFDGKLTIETNTGTYEVPVKAVVREMPDFKPIVTEGADLVTFKTNPKSPFIVENGVAYNASSGEPDESPDEAWFEVDFEIPKGKAGFVTWDGHTYGNGDVSQIGDSEKDDYSRFEYAHDLISGIKMRHGDTDAGSSVFDGWKGALTCTLGKHHYKFWFVKNGDSKISEKDRLEISNFKLRVEDFPEHKAELLNKEVTFDSIYVGPQRVMKTKVTMHNIGGEPLTVSDVKADGPFYGIVPKGSANFDDNLDVELWFFPEEEGKFTGNVTIVTNAGDFIVKCNGETKSRKGIVLVGDFEDDAYGWHAYDGDGDGNTWDLGFNFFGGYFPLWVHSGQQCMASASYTWQDANTKPDNWLFSPEITIPEDGATLSWYAAAHSKKRPAEHYSVYVEEPVSFQDPNNLGTLTPLFTETLDETAAQEDPACWRNHALDLKKYAGKTVCIAFRHHDCIGQYLLKLDDVFVYAANNSAGIKGLNSGIENGKNVVRQEIYDMSGRKTNSLREGVNLIRKYYSDGTVKTTKLFRK